MLQFKPANYSMFLSALPDGGDHENYTSAFHGCCLRVHREHELFKSCKRTIAEVRHSAGDNYWTEMSDLAGKSVPVQKTDCSRPSDLGELLRRTLGQLFSHSVLIFFNFVITTGYENHQFWVLRASRTAEPSDSPRDICRDTKGVRTRLYRSRHEMCS